VPLWARPLARRRHVSHRGPDPSPHSCRGPEPPRAIVGASASPMVRHRHVSHGRESSAGSQPTCRIKCGRLRRALPEQSIGRPPTRWTDANDNTVSPLVTEAGTAPRAWAASHDDRLQTRITVRAAIVDRGDSSALHHTLYACRQKLLCTDRTVQGRLVGRYAQRPTTKISGSEAFKALRCTLCNNISPGSPVEIPHCVHAPLGHIKGRA